MKESLSIILGLRLFGTKIQTNKNNYESHKTNPVQIPTDFKDDKNKTRSFYWTDLKDNSSFEPIQSTQLMVTSQPKTTTQTSITQSKRG